MKTAKVVLCTCTLYYILLSSPLLWQLRILVWLVNDLLRPLLPRRADGRQSIGLRTEVRWVTTVFVCTRRVSKLNSNPLSYYTMYHCRLQCGPVKLVLTLFNMRVVEAGRRRIQSSSSLIGSDHLLWRCVGHLTLWGVASSNCDGSCAVFVIWIGHGTAAGTCADLLFSWADDFTHGGPSFLAAAPVDVHRK